MKTTINLKNGYQYPVIEDGDVIVVKNFAENSEFRIEQVCCDCGLVHDVTITLRSNGDLALEMTRCDYGPGEDPNVEYTNKSIVIETPRDTERGTAHD